MNAKEWEQLRDDAGEGARLQIRRQLERALDEAERLIDREHYTTDNANTGIIYQHGSANIQRVPVEVYVMMVAIIRGVGMAAQWSRERKSKATAQAP